MRNRLNWLQIHRFAGDVGPAGRTRKTGRSRRALKLQGLRTLALRAVAAALVAAGAAMLAACSAGNTIADHLPNALGGLPEGTPQRPATPAAYPAVHDVPPPRTDTMLSEEEQKRLEDELVAARNRAEATAGKPAGSAGSP